MRHLLLDCLVGQDVARQRVRYLQALLPSDLSVQVVPEQWEKLVPTLPQRDRISWLGHETQNREVLTPFYIAVVGYK